jgi:hypothetical protein
LSTLEFEVGDETSAMDAAETIIKDKPLTPPSGMRKPAQLATQVLAISIPRNLSVDIAVKGDELKKDDLAKIKSQFNRWIQGLEEAPEE